MVSVKALVLTGYGVNCEAETAEALRVAGADVKIMHLNDVIGGSLEEFHILAMPGGFSFGDDLGSGKVFANKMKHKLREELLKFVEDGKLVIGICNGCQMLVKLGLVPALDGKYFEQSATLMGNASGRFEDRWVRVKANEKSKCVFTKGIGTFELPVRHGEGRFVLRDEETRKRLHAEGLVALQYVDEKGETTMDYPANPNGTVDGIAGICDVSGRVFGVMPHPEAHVWKFTGPHWTREKGKEEGSGLKVFKNAVDFVKSEF